MVCEKNGSNLGDDTWERSGTIKHQGKSVGRIISKHTYNIVETQIRGNPKEKEYAVWHGKTAYQQMPTLLGIYPTIKEAVLAAEEHEQTH